jgi:hypothetical protein
MKKERHMSRHTSIGIALLLLTSVLATSARAVDYYAFQDIPIASGEVINDYTYTHASDDAYESIVEAAQNSGRPSTRYTYLEHQWPFDVAAGYDLYTFHLEAHAAESEENESFIFGYSTDGVTFTDIITVANRSDDDTEQTYRFLEPLSGIVYIRVRDNYRHRGQMALDTVHIDRMYIRGEPDLAAPTITNVAAETVSGSAWVHLSPEVVGGPLEPRELHAMAYDSSADKTIMFGGEGDNDHLADTWAYDYTTNTWNERNPTVVGGTLTPRVAHAMVYDSAANRMIMFGGWYYVCLGDTWTYDYGSNTWTNADPDVVGGPLEGRWHHAMVYDPVANLTIMVGAVHDACETWVYDYGDNAWYNRTPTMTVVGGELPAIGGHFLAYDCAAGFTIMYGGSTPAGETSDTWAYDARDNTWYNMTPTMTVLGGTLTPRHRHSMVYEPATGKVMMFGGQNGNEQLGDTWTYDYSSNTWLRLEPPAAGGTLCGREESAMVYDSAHAVIILFGGFTYEPHPPSAGDGPCLRDTWMYTAEPTTVITWSTDELSDSVVRYGELLPPGSAVENGTMLESHSVVLRSLETYPAYYYYEAQSTDVGNNTTIDDNDGAYYTFTVGAPNNAPDAPGSPSPADAAGDVPLSVNLSVYVSDPDGDDMDISFYGARAGDPAALIGRVYPVASETYATVPWEGLAADATYNWYAVANDLELSTQSATWHFTTGPENAMHVGAIDMWCTTQGNKYRVYTKVTVVDAFGLNSSTQ